MQLALLAVLAGVMLAVIGAGRPWATVGAEVELPGIGAGQVGAAELTGNDLGPYGAPTASAVVDQHGLAPAARELLRERAGVFVERPAGCVRHDDANGLQRILLGEGRPARCEQCNDRDARRVRAESAQRTGQNGASLCRTT